MCEGNIKMKNETYGQTQERRNRSIIRQACIKASCDTYKVKEANDDEANKIIGLAKKFEEWILKSQNDTSTS